MKIKICGMKYANNITQVSELKPDFMGFIFWDKSARYFNETLPEIPKSIQKVGVFVDASLDEIRSKTKQHQLDLVQLHGKESAIFCNELKAENTMIIKAFSVDSDFDFEILSEYDAVCDYFLFDTKGKLPGGNGTVFDWNLLQKYRLNKPYFLSGGIGLDEVTKIKSFLKSDVSKNCIAIDINSKFETKPGLKNTNELSQFKKLLYENKL